MNAVTGMPGVTCQDNLWTNRQVLKPEIITEKNWQQEYEGYSSGDPLTWDNSILSIPMKYAGGYEHQFKVYILATSEERTSFTLILEDLTTNDHLDALMHRTIYVDLKEYAHTGTEFKVMRLGWGNSASKIGESTFA